MDYYEVDSLTNENDFYFGKETTFFEVDYCFIFGWSDD